MKRFFLGMLIGWLVVSVLWLKASAVSPAYAPPRSVPPPMRPLYALNDQNQGFPPVANEAVGDIPVPIVPGSRVTDAQIAPPNATPRRAPGPPARRRFAPRVLPPPVTTPPVRAVSREITGQLSVTEDRAREDARKKLDEALAKWLAPEVPSSWDVPARLRDALVLKTEVRSVEKNLDGESVTLYEATITADLGPHRRTEILQTYHHELVARRLAILGGILAFIIACLAALAGYIRADEATKGYYTNRLRLASAAGVGAAGVLIYQLLV